MSEIPEPILEALEEIASYVGETTDWMVVKKQVLLAIAPALRTNFSTRDPKTKKQSFNEFEVRVCDWWENKTGRRLQILK
jgi:hypothetical protein